MAVHLPLARVVVVEDHEDDVFVLSHLLEKAGLQVTPQIFSTGEAAVEFLAHAASQRDPLAIPTAMFADVWLPGLSGLDLLKWVRHHEALEPMSMVLLSASDEPRDLGKAGRLGADGYVIKFPPPSAMREILAAIRQAATAPRPRPLLPVSCNLLAGVTPR